MTGSFRRLGKVLGAGWADDSRLRDQSRPGGETGWRLVALITAQTALWVPRADLLAAFRARGNAGRPLSTRWTRFFADPQVVHRAMVSSLPEPDCQGAARSRRCAARS